MKTEQWKNYDQYKQTNVLVREHYDTVHHCHSLALCNLLPTRCRRSLDIACGYGESTRLISRFSETVIGIDSSAEMIRLANEQALGDKFRFICTSFEEFEPEGEKYDLISGTWFLNHIHDEPSLDMVLEKTSSLLNPGGFVSFVVPSASFTSRPIQRLVREEMEWQQAWTNEQANWTKGVFSYGGEWIPTTVWQPIFLMRRLNRWFDIRAWDVKGTIVNEHRMHFLDTEPPFEVFYGQKLDQKGV